MKFAYSSNAYRRYSLIEAIERIASAGYSGAELMADVPHAWPASITDDEIAGIKRSLQEHSLEISNINAFMMCAVQDFWHPSWIEPEREFRRRRVQHTIDSLHLAYKLGAACITTEPGGPIDRSMKRDDALRLFVEGLQEALVVAEKLGVRLLVEPEPGLLVENAEQFEALAGMIHSPMFGLNFDVGHFYCVNDDLPSSIEKLSKWTHHYHVEDIAASRIHEHLIPGRGAIDFAAVMQAIRGTNYAGWLTVELYPYLDDPDAAGVEALQFLQKHSAS